MKDLEKTLEKYFLDKAPALPEDLQRLIVQYGPYVLLVFVIIAGINLISLFGYKSSVLNPFGFLGGYNVGGWYQLYLVTTAIILVLEALALPGLFHRKMQGWRYMYYAALVALVQSIITFNIAAVIVGSGLTFYILYQIKKHYAA